MVFLINASFRVPKIKSKNQSKRFKCPEVETQLCFSYHFLFVVIFDFFSKTTGLISTKLDMKHFLVTGGVRFFNEQFFETNETEKLVWKYPQIVYVQVCLNHDPGDTVSGQIYT